jgi:hypothetical protein
LKSGEKLTRFHSFLFGTPLAEFTKNRKGIGKVSYAARIEKTGESYSALKGREFLKQPIGVFV